MYPIINIPVFIFNTIFCSWAWLDIYRNYKSSKFTPRLIMTAITIFGAYPSSFLVVLACFINSPILTNKPACYTYMVVNWLEYLIPLSLLSLSIFVCIIMFSSLKRKDTNKIGKYLIAGIWTIYAVVQLVILPLSGAAPRREYRIEGTGNFHRFCDMADTTTLKILYTSTGITSLLSLLTATIILIYNLSQGKLGTSTSNGRLIISFILFSLANFWYVIRYWFKEIFGIKMKLTTEYVLLDFTKIAPGLFALIYLFLDAFTRKKPIELDISKILSTKRFRKQFKSYLFATSDRYKYNLIKKWEGIQNSGESNFSIMGEMDLSKKEASLIIEKNLELDLPGFLMSEEWRDFYEEYRKTSSLDDQLLDRVEGNNCEEK